MNGFIDFEGDTARSATGGIGGLALDEFHTYRYESLDTGRNYWFSVDGVIFVVDDQNASHPNSAISFSGSGGCDGDTFVDKQQEWDYIRYGTISFGEQIIAADPPAGVLDATPGIGLDRFTVTFDTPNYVYLDDITVAVTGGTAPVITQTQRPDDGDPAKVEIVFDRPMPVHETTTFTFDDGVAVSVVEYTVLPIGACCLADGSCEVLADTDCASTGGNFLDGPCAGDPDGDGIDGRCGDGCPADPFKTEPGLCGCGRPDTDSDSDGVPDCTDPCPLDNPDDTDGDGICDSVDICPGYDDNIDSDGDTVPDCQDQCPGVDDAVYAPECSTAIPTTTTWGLTIFALVLMIAAKLCFRRRRHPLQNS